MQALGSVMDFSPIFKHTLQGDWKGGFGAPLHFCIYAEDDMITNNTLMLYNHLFKAVVLMLCIGDVQN